MQKGAKQRREKRKKARVAPSMRVNYNSFFLGGNGTESEISNSKAANR